MSNIVVYHHMQIKKICIRVWNYFQTRCGFSLGFETHPPDQNKMLWLGNRYMNN